MATGQNLRDLVDLVEQTDDSLRFDIFYYLFTQWSPEEIQSLGTLLEEERHSDLRQVFMDAEQAWRQYGISMGMMPANASPAEHLMFYLGRLKYFSEPGGGAMNVPDYYGFGREYWKSIKKELHSALCTRSPKYSQERKKLTDFGTTSVTVAVPAVMAALSLPASLAGVAIVLSVFISKIGLNAFCRTVKKED